MGKSKGSTTTTTAPDAQSQEYMRQAWAAAQGAAGSPGTPVNGLSTDAARGFGGFAQAGNLGLRAMSGDAGAISQFMDPYQQHVIDSLNTQYGHDRESTMNSVNDAATAAHAFGGSRHGVATGVALGELGRGHEAQVAGLLDSGYNNAMSRAGSMANMGFGANGALAGLGEYMHGVDVSNDPRMRQYQFLTGAMAGMPHGSTTTATQTNGHNGVTGALGGAATGAQIGSAFGPWGTGIGAAAGGLMGMFG